MEPSSDQDDRPRLPFRNGSGNRLLLIILAAWFLVYLYAGLQKGPG